MLQDQRSRTRRLILDTIRRSGRIARIDLARVTGISQATVTTITAEMLRTGLISEVSGEDQAKGARRGRPRVDLTLRGEAHLVAGVKVAHGSLSVALMDFAGLLVGEHTARLTASVLAPEVLAAEIAEAVAQAARRAGLAATAVSVVGIGMSGIVDATRGFVYWSPSLDRRNLPFQDIVAEQVHCPVFLDNDANLVAVAEQVFGEGAEMTDFLVVTIEAGVGMGIVLNGDLYRGARGCGAEFGHTKVQLDGALCRCGQRGCLEAYVADYALLREAAVGRPGGYDSIGALMADARGGNAVAQSVLSRAGRMFAMGLANLINTFDPQKIILAGERMQSDHLYAEEVMTAIRSQIVQVDLPAPEIVVHKWGDLMWARGAAAYAIDRVAEMSLRGISDAA